MEKGFIFVVIVMIVAMAAVGAYIWQNEQDKAQLRQIVATTPTPLAQATPTPTPPSTPSIEASQSGTITGSLAFPSEYIPTMEVCAERISSSDEFCTDDREESASESPGATYQLIVPAGEYFVYAKLPNDPYKAYYSEFVTCGLSVECQSHEPIAVTVTAGETVENVNPHDWYNREAENDTDQ